MSNNKEQQQEEIDLLQNIIFDKMKILESEPNYKIYIEIKSEIPEAKMKFDLTITLNDEYPDKEPSFELLEVNNYLASKKVNELKEKLLSLCNEYLSMPMIYQMYEFILTYVDEEEQKILNEEKAEQIKLEEEKRLLEEKQREEEQKLLEQRTYTPVTKELFENWYKDFVKKQHEIMKKNNPFMDKISGRQFFMNKNLKLDENEEDKAKKDEDEEKTDEKEDEKEENVEYNPELYEEDIGNIDFDKDDIDIDNI